MVQSIPVLLPPLTTFPDVVAYRPERVGAEYLLLYFDMVAMGKKYVESLLHEPARDVGRSHCGGLCFDGHEQPPLAFCKPRGSDHKWTLLPNTEDGTPVVYKNVVFWRNKFYAVEIYNRILVCDLDIPNVSFLAREMGIQHLLYENSYLVVGPADELMFVGRIHVEGEDVVGVRDEQLDAGQEEEDAVGEDDRASPSIPEKVVDDDRHEVDDQNVECIWDSDSDDEWKDRWSYKTREFTVYKLNEDTNQWDEVKSIGDYALFLGTNTPACLSTQDHPGYKPNCIYFTDDYFEKQKRRRHDGHDMGIYNLSDGTIESLCCTNLYEKPSLVWPPPVWVWPTIY
ncbi:unnamed protein product [Linum trigynum]|uniref:KIB1-4 beta-propeller domain-containing protein n=1 Tax=Linum trigynum TaxID=586398 RepID=A0AAV2DGN0_9ROSI